jgi:hypothetical protein
MEPHETFIGRAMRLFNVQARLPMRVEPLEVEPKGWGDNAIKVIPIDLQHMGHRRTKMNLATQRHGNLYRFKEILFTHLEKYMGVYIQSL